MNLNEIVQHNKEIFGRERWNREYMNACSEGNTGALEMLAHELKGEEVKKRFGWEWDIHAGLAVALWNGHESTIRWILKWSESLNQEVINWEQLSDSWESVVLRALQKQELNILNLLDEPEVQRRINKPIISECSGMHFRELCQGNRVQSVEWMLMQSEKKRIKSRRMWMESGLKIACTKKHWDIVTKIVEDKNFVYSPAMKALFKNNEEAQQRWQACQEKKAWNELLEIESQQKEGAKKENLPSIPIKIKRV